MTDTLDSLRQRLDFLEAAHSHNSDCPCAGDCDPATCECGDGHDCDEMQTYEGAQDRHLTETFAALDEFVRNVRTLLADHNQTPDTRDHGAS
ncbi:hypothetical protein ACIRG5_45615 [Lentzea sp. NPDC102401]|uniref:hypothetical protein n=1 Tax=Lentzea sp. NPDC102401 TaxID=3364128 RepID=UPI00381E9147